MSETVELVARAICVARHWSPENWDLAEPEARAAINALRVPTESVKKEVARSLCDHAIDIDPDALLDEKPDDPENPLSNWHLYCHAAGLVINAMVDEALK